MVTLCLRRERVKRAVRGKALAIPCDVADAAQVEAAAAQAEEAFGPIDVWINNAMVTVFSPLKLLKPAEFRRVTDVSYHGAVYGTMAALRRMTPRDVGTIIQVGSALAFRGIPLQSAYCGSQFALRGFTEAVRSELIHEGSRVHVGMVQLGAINTPQFGWARSHLPYHPQPLPPIYQPEVAAEAGDNSLQLKASQHRHWLALGAAVAGLLAASGARRRTRRA